RLIIPAGTEVHGVAQVDRERERIASGNRWTLVMQDGEELTLNGIALDRETDTNGVGWGITDGSAGLRGRLIKTDDMAEIKLFAATFLSAAAGTLNQNQQTVLGYQLLPNTQNAALQGAQGVLGAYAKQIYDSIQRDGFYVRVPAGKQFYLYVTQTIDREDAAIGESRSDSNGINNPPPQPQARREISPIVPMQP
ncbi:MAG: TrbI/VirB10 family protein, partial [Limisphaerales bacterium]